MSIIERFVNTLDNDEIHDLLAHLSQRMLIVKWYQKEDIESIINTSISQEDWESTLQKLNSVDYDTISEPVDNSVKEYFREKVSRDEDWEDSEEDMLTLSSQLSAQLSKLTSRKLAFYAGVNNNSLSKDKLIKLICERFLGYLCENKRDVINKKLENLHRQLE